MEVEGEVEVECKCPKCGYKFTTKGYYCHDMDLSDLASDSEWRD
jgi:hypothetical protein